MNINYGTTMTLSKLWLLIKKFFKEKFSLTIKIERKDNDKN